MWNKNIVLIALLVLCIPAVLAGETRLTDFTILYEGTPDTVTGGGNETWYADNRTTGDLLVVNDTGIFIYNSTWNYTLPSNSHTLLCNNTDGLITLDEDDIIRNTSEFRTYYNYNCTNTNVTLQYFTLDTIQNGVSMYFTFPLTADRATITQAQIYLENASWTKEDNIACSADTITHNQAGQFFNLEDIVSVNEAGTITTTGLDCPTNPISGGGGSGGSGSSNSSGGGGTGGSSSTVIIGEGCGATVIVPGDPSGLLSPLCPANGTKDEFIQVYNPYSTDAEYEIVFEGISCEDPGIISVPSGTTKRIDLLNCVCPADKETSTGLIKILDKRSGSCQENIVATFKGNKLAAFFTNPANLFGIAIAIIVIITSIILLATVGGRT